MTTLKTRMTEQLGIQHPIIAAPMFLVSNENMVIEASEAGAIGIFPALNYRPITCYIETLKAIRQKTKQPIGVNIIVNKSNKRQQDDLKYALEYGVDLFITSLGSPKEVIEAAHKNGAKVYCDVTNREHAKKVEDLGADGLIAVSSGAGGHAGPISPFVLIPWLRQQTQLPIIAAGGVADGWSLAAALAAGADGVSVGTRFIASTESTVSEDYKQAILSADPEDIVLTNKISGTPASVINTEYIRHQGRDLHWFLGLLKSMPATKKYTVPLIHLLGMKTLETAAHKTTWKQVWSAGQSVGLVHEIKPCRQIILDLMQETEQAIQRLNDMKLSYQEVKS